MPDRTYPRITLGLLLLMFGLVGAGVLAGHLHHQAPAGATPASVSRFTIHGSISSPNASPGCGSAPNTVRTGAPVTVLDATGAVLATTSLGPARSGPDAACTWGYSLTVPVTATYQIQVAGIPPVSVARSSMPGGAFSEQDPVPSTNGNPLDTGL